MTITGASTPARMRAAVEPRKIRRGAANRLEPTTRTSASSQLSFFSADSSVMPSATRDSISGESGRARAATAQVLSAAATCIDRSSLTFSASARFSADTNDTVRMASRAALASVIANGSGLSVARAGWAPRP